MNPSINKEQKYPRIEYKINYRLNFDEKKNPSSDNNEKENDRLSSLRDTLLPKLINGFWGRSRKSPTSSCVLKMNRLHQA